MSIWPFTTKEQLAAFTALREQGYALLRQAHEMFLAAVKDSPK